MSEPVPAESAAVMIDRKIQELGDWRGKTLAIDIREGEYIDAAALKELIRAAVALNLSKRK